MWGYYAADFIRENGGWRIWHLRFITDIETVAGRDWTREQQPDPARPEFAVLANVQVPAPNVPCQLQEPYHLKRLPMVFPTLPHPYVHFAETTSYGI